MVTKSRRQKRFERKIKDTKILRDQFIGDRPILEERIAAYRQKLVDLYRG